MNDSAATTPGRPTLRGLDWLNFFLADVQTGVGPSLRWRLPYCIFTCLKLVSQRRPERINEDHHFAVLLQRIHDLCLVWAPQVRPRVAALESHPGILAHRPIG